MIACTAQLGKMKIACVLELLGLSLLEVVTFSKPKYREKVDILEIKVITIIESEVVFSSLSWTCDFDN